MFPMFLCFHYVIFYARAIFSLFFFGHFCFKMLVLVFMTDKPKVDRIVDETAAVGADAKIACWFKGFPDTGLCIH